MVDFQDIYFHHAEQYDLLVAREDYRHQILPALDRIRPLAGLDVVEMGAGTGRLTCLLAPRVDTLRAFDVSQPMLDVAAARLASLGLHNWTVEVADNRALPLPDGVADLVLAGWSFGHSVAWYEERWRAEIGRALAEMQRVLRPGGTAVILETLGTGRETPEPPTEGLADYYAWLEHAHGFSSTWIRTDYEFDSLAEAADLTGFFFGDDFARQVVEQQWIILPECTGLWWRRTDCGLTDG